MQETLKANPYVYADNDAVNEVDPDGAAACNLTSNDNWTIADLAIGAAGLGLSIAGFAMSATVAGFVVGILSLAIAIYSLSRAYMGIPQLEHDCPALGEIATYIVSHAPHVIG